MPDFDLTGLEDAIDAAFQATAEEFANQCQEEITTPQWTWDGVTYRQNGTVVGSPRDIVDTETLLRSQRLERISDWEYRIAYEVNYAAIVHEGAILKNGKEYPARPWIDAAIANLDVAEYFEKQLGDSL